MSKLLNQKRYTFQLTKRNPEKTANGRAYPPQVTIPSESVMYVDGRPVAIRYAINEDTIIKKEQSEFAKQAPAIALVDGHLNIGEREAMMLDYMRKTVYNSANNFEGSGFKTIFREVDYEKETADQITDLKRAGEALVEFWKMQGENQDRARAVSRRLGVNTKTPSWILGAVKFVEKNPDEFLKFIANGKEVELAERIDALDKAAEINIIDFALGTWSWVGAGDIINVPKGQDALEELAMWTFNSGAGQTVWTRINTKLNGDKKVEENIDKVVDVTKKALLAAQDMTSEELLAKGKEAGVVTRKGAYFYYTIEGEDEITLGKSNTEAISLLRKENKLRNDLVLRVADFIEPTLGLLSE